ncbi:hypothetical protein [Pectobacterium versatile]|uniref:hypothetical protein n=1 Tax=Pectobacterium versatile TaxID=2488639 RepID=UPI0020BDC9F4|nr:hypothetical protein [Pectobacterium versatile]
MTDNILSRYNLPSGKKLVLLDRLGMENLYKRVEIARKIYFPDEQGETVWQVSSDFDSEGNPFTNMTLHSDGRITAYRWDGGNYTINTETGFTTPSMLMK